MHEVEAILLAGGKGIRMGELTNEIQKCLLPLDGKPILGYVVESILQAFGSVDLKVAVNYRAQEVKSFLDKYYSPKITINYIPHQEGVDSWGAYYSMKDQVHSPFVGLPADVIADPQVYESALTAYFSEKADLIMSISPRVEKVDTHALVRENCGNVVDIIWPANTYWPSGSSLKRDMTIYASDQRFFRYLEKYKAPGSATIKSFKEALQNDDISISANTITSDWLHVGYPHDLGLTA